MDEQNYSKSRGVFIDKTFRNILPVGVKAFISVGKQPRNKDVDEKRLVREIKNGDDVAKIVDDLIIVYKHSKVLCSCVSSCFGKIKECIMCNGNKIEGKVV